MTQFSAIKDREIIEAGGFFCESCLVGKTKGYQSPDPRYCQECYDWLKGDAEDLLYRGTTRQPAWWPKGLPTPRRPRRQDASVETPAPPEPCDSRMSAISPMSQNVTSRILTLQKEKMPCRAIAEALKAEGLAEISYRTVARIIKGQGALI